MGGDRGRSFDAGLSGSQDPPTMLSSWSRAFFALTLSLAACRGDGQPTNTNASKTKAAPVEPAMKDGEAVPSATPPSEAETVKPELPICTDATALGTLDGERIRLVGHYRKSLTARKMGGPKASRGEIHIELEGTAADYDPRGSDKGPAIVEIGVRPSAEVEELVDQRVRVDGVLRLDPYEEIREAGVDYATVIYGPPQLDDVDDVQRADAD